MLMHVKDLALKLYNEHPDKFKHDDPEELAIRVMKTAPFIELRGNRIAVLNSYYIKDTLKNLGYQYDGAGAWEKKIATTNEAIQEFEKLHQLKDEITHDSPKLKQMFQ